MKYIKKYNENIDIDWNDFDFEEEDDNFNIGDMITPINIKNTRYWYHNIWNQLDTTYLIRKIKKIEHSDNIKPKPYDYIGYMVFVSGTDDNLWFKITDMKKDN